MAPERFHEGTDILLESQKISDALLAIQNLGVQAGRAAEDDRLASIRDEMLYGEPPSTTLDSLVDVRIADRNAVVTPRQVNTVLPVSEHSAEVTETARYNIERIIRKEDDRLIAVIGPCSIHDPVAAIEYAKFVKAMREKYGDDLEIIMRDYMEKPRTEKDWKGFVYDPKLDESDDINVGLVATRMLTCHITDLGVPVAMERLNANTPQYVNGLVAYDVIGARNATDQKAREYASGTSSPVGFKNSVDGDLKTAIEAIVSARAPHSFLGMDEDGYPMQVRTTGNESAHLILRGGKRPNYHPRYIKQAKSLVDAKNEKLLSQGEKPIDLAIAVDASHGNSGKDYKKQIEVVKSIARQVRLGETALVAVMVESNIKAGKQDLKKAIKEDIPLEYGKSITDACVDLEETELMLGLLAKAVQQRRRRNSVTLAA